MFLDNLTNEAKTSFLQQYFALLEHHATLLKMNLSTLMCNQTTALFKLSIFNAGVSVDFTT